MTLKRTLSGQILTRQGILPGRLTFDENILDIYPDPDESLACFILPGFIDTHVHGGGGGDTMDGLSGLKTMAALHAQHGTTTLLPTTITAEWSTILDALQAFHTYRSQPKDELAADMVGIHLEGPFISARKLGAQPPLTLEPTIDRVQDLLRWKVIRAVTLAPELPGAFEAVELFVKKNVRIGIGHSTADVDTTERFIRHVAGLGGQVSGTHLFNAMNPLQGREPGVLGALMTSNAWLEVIFDNVHVHPLNIKFVACVSPDRLMIVSDAMRAAGQEDGESEIGGQKVHVKNGAARLSNGTLAGSVLTLDTAFRNAVSAGFTIAQTSHMLSTAPARSIGLTDRGELDIGQRADLVVMDLRLNLREVYIQGIRVR